MQQKIKRLRAQLGDLKGKSKDTLCVLDTLNSLPRKLENENVELEFQVLNYAKEYAHLKTTYKNLFDSITVSRTQTKTIIASLQNKLHNTIYENAKLRAQLFNKVSDQKDNKRGTSANTKFTKQSIMGNLPKVGEIHALSNPVTSNSISTPQESKVMKNDKVIAPGMFRINPFKTSREEKHVPNTVRASVRTKPITVSQPPVFTKKDVNSDSNGLSSTGIDNTKTRMPHPRSNTNNDWVPSASKSSCNKNKGVEVEEHHRNLLLSKNKKHMSSACNNVKLATHNVKSKVVCAMCKQCLISVNHDVCLLNSVNGKTSCGKNQKANVSINEKQKKQQPKVRKTKKVGFIKRFSIPKSSKPRCFLRWSPTGRKFDLKGKIIASSKSESQSDCSKSDNACTPNPMEPTIKRFPNSTFSLAGQFCDSDLEVAFRRNTCFVRNLEGFDLLKGDRSTNLYTINLHEMAFASSICLMARASSTKSWLWHQCLTHLNFDTINDLAKNDLVFGLLKFKYHKEHLCSSCEQGKSKRASHPPKPVPNSRQRLHLLHMDLCGPIRIASINGKRVGISHQMSSVRTPQQNGVVERKNRTLVEAARTMLIFSRALLFLWAEAIATACFTQNRSIIHRRFNKTPYELINGRKPDISFLYVFEALYYPKNDREDIGKLGAKETMNVSFDELSAMAFEQRSSKPGLQSMTFGQISSGLDLTYAPSTITTQQPTEGELDLLFKAMYDDYIGGQPSAEQVLGEPSRPILIRNQLRSDGDMCMYALTSSVIIIRTDNGTEFKNQVLKVYFDSVGISHQISSVRTPQQNGVMERQNQTLVEAARTMLIFSRASLFLWAEAIATACFTQNRSIIHRRFNKTPYELINGKKPDISFLHVFGALCYPKNDCEDIGKLGAKGDIGFFIRYSVDSCAYRIYNRRTKKIMETMNVLFDELSAMAFKQRSSKPGLQSMTSGQICSELDLTYAPSTITKQQPTEGELDLLSETTSTASTTIADNVPIPTNSSSHATNIPITSQDVDELNPNAMIDGNTFVNPFATSYSNAAETSSSQNVDPSNMHTFYQPYPHEFQWTKDHPLEQNVKEAMTDPAWIKSMQEELLQFKRMDVLYGLKQAPKAWYDELLTFLLQNHFFKGTIDPTLFIRRFDDDFLVVHVYVDDIIFSSTHPRYTQLFFDLMKSRFEMSMIREMIFFLGLQVNQSPCRIFINQSNYVLEILKKYGMESCDTVGTPMEIKDKLNLDQNGTPVDATKYRSMIGALMYLTSSRPNIVHATCLCAQYQAKPTEKHLKDSGFELTGFSYADYAGCKDTFKSTSDGAQFLGEKLVSWSSKKQDCTALSTTKAEYVSLYANCTQVLWIRTQLTNYGFHFKKIPIYYDSKSAIAISCNTVQHSRTKHIAVRYHFIKEHMEKGMIELYIVKTDYQLADLLTKALLVDRFNYLVCRLECAVYLLRNLIVLQNHSNSLFISSEKQNIKI
uniref:Retrovirus-related Pol polyprotein from transposon TNT 1-94 n=1 Tax=Tanacetum cinerariifolium TaxID=118510 RepID=A0A6L2J9R2_TANCI|nr:retrovirus-related Pol polyprotein from transposon TNT 1-94 [Tanacetum cinerariifolium]